MNNYEAIDAILEEMNQGQIDYLLKVSKNDLAFSERELRKAEIRDPENEDMIRYFKAIISAQKFNVQILTNLREIKNER